MQQLAAGSWQQLAFYSKKLSGAGTRYSTFDREQMAAFSTIRHLQILLEGQCFRVLTDHKPLATALFRTTPPWSACLQRQLSFIAKFTSDIRHTPGQDNVVADALRRLPTSLRATGRHTAKASPAADLLHRCHRGLAGGGVGCPRPISSLAAIADVQPVDFSVMASQQQSCPEVAEMLNSGNLQIISQGVGGASLLVDVSTGVYRPLVPIQSREAVFQLLHTIHHPGVQATQRLITNRFCWPQMAKAITLMARACLFCQHGKEHKHVHLQPAEIPVPHCRFAHIHVDLCHPHMATRTVHHDRQNILEARGYPIPLHHRQLDLQVWSAGHHHIRQRAQFTSTLWATLCNMLNINHSPATAFHPPSNGLVERFHRQLTDALLSRTAAADWHYHLPWVMLGIRASFQEDSQFSPTEAVFGSQLVLQGQFVNIAVDVPPRGSTDRHGWPLTTADATQLSSSSNIST